MKICYIEIEEMGDFKRFGDREYKEWSSVVLLDVSVYKYDCEDFGKVVRLF